MTVTQKHTIYAVQIEDTVPVVIPGIVGGQVRLNSEVRAEATDGSLYARHVAMHAQAPDAEFQTVDLVTALTNIALAGLDLASLATGFNVYAYKHAKGAGRASGASHREYQFKDGIIVPTRLTCDHQGDAVLTYQLFATYDGTNAPVVVTDSHAVPSAGAASRFSLGRITIGAVVLSQVKSVEIDFGNSVSVEGADSDVWPTHASIDTTLPTVTLRGINVEYLKAANVPIQGLAATHANTEILFRKRSITADGYVAAGTAEHLRITAAGMAVVDDAFNAQPPGAAESSVMLTTTYDGTNAPLVITAGSSYTP